MTFADPGRAGKRLGNGVQRVDTSTTVYLASDDVVELIERVDSYLGDTSWRIVTLDQTNSGLFYAFLTRF